MKNTLRIESLKIVHVINKRPRIICLSDQVNWFKNHSEFKGAVLKFAFIYGDSCLSFVITIVLELYFIA